MPLLPCDDPGFCKRSTTSVEARGSTRQNSSAWPFIAFGLGVKLLQLFYPEAAVGFQMLLMRYPRRETRFHNPANFPAPNLARTFPASLAATAMSARLSGVQREVNQLYRRVLRAAKLKDGGSGSTTELVKTEFREQARNDGDNNHNHGAFFPLPHVRCNMSLVPVHDRLAIVS